MPVPELYKFKKTKRNEPVQVFTREQAIQYIVDQWGPKYGTSAEEAGDELDGGYSADFTRLTSRQYNARVKKQSGSPPTRRLKRCPRGTRRNKATGLCTAK